MTVPPFATYVASHDGHTLRIAARMLGRLGQPADAAVRLGAEPPEIDANRPVLLLAAVRYGRHLAPAEAFLARYAALPERPPLAFASVNLTARKPNKQTAEESAYLRKSITTHGVQPVAARAFAGRLDYPSYSLFDRTMIRFIMWITNGPTDPSTVQEFTDWADVDAFADSLPAVFGLHAAAEPG